MKTQGKLTAIAVLIVAALSFAALAGCATGEQQDTAAKNRSYLSQANTMTMQLNADIQPFVEAVAADDVVTMEQAAANVYKDIDAFKALNPPEDMKDIHKEYCDGCDELKQALQQYVALYKDAADTDVKDLNESIASVKKLYDSGIAHLQAADKKITELPGATPSSSSSAANANSSSSGK